MKERSVSRRNFVGAFWGGLLGILTLGYLHPATLPFGCFFGVIIGWRYQEILQSMKDSVRRNITRTQKGWGCLVLFVTTPTWSLKKKFQDAEQWMNGLSVALHFFLFIFIWIMRRLITLVLWLNIHPMNRAYTTQALTVFAYLIINALWLVPLMTYCARAIDTNNDGALSIVYLIVGLLFIPTIVACAPLTFWCDEQTPKMKRFYLKWERYAKEGAGRFFIKSLKGLFRLEISMLLMMSGTLLWFTGVGGAFLLLVVVPISAAIGTVKAIYRVSIKGGHWLCYGTTVVTTSLIAWITYPYLNDTRILWIVALTAGLLSAAATEALRRSIVLFFDKSDRAILIVADTIGSQLAPTRRIFWKITTALGEKFNHLLPIPLYL